MNATPNRRRFQYSLVTLFLAMVYVAIFFAMQRCCGYEVAMLTVAILIFAHIER